MHRRSVMSLSTQEKILRALCATEYMLFGMRNRAVMLGSKLMEQATAAQL